MNKTRRPLLKQQRPALAYARSTPHPALWMQMRLGKTAPCIRAVESYRSRSPDGRVRALVVAPNSALGDWCRELELEGVAPEEIVRLEGSRQRRLLTLADRDGGARWFLANKESWQVLPEIAGAARCDECVGHGWVRGGPSECEHRTCTNCRGKGYHPGLYNAPLWDAVVADESTFLKGPRSRASQFYLANFRDVPHRWSLTGLPNPESLLDYWCQLAWLDGRALGCGSYWEFRAKMFVESADGFDPRDGADEQIARMVAARAYVLRRDDSSVEFHKARERREVSMPSNIRRAYDTAERDFILEFGGREIKRTIYATPRWVWMRQMCGGFVDGKLVWPGKIKELTLLLRGELAREQVLVWFAFNQEIDATLAAMSRARIPAVRVYGADSTSTRQAHVEAWRDGRARVLLAQQAALCKGVDLSVADTAVYYSTHASGEMREQSEERISHPQKRRSLLLIDLVAPKTVDEDVVELLALKYWRSDGALRRAVLLRAQARSAA